MDNEHISKDLHKLSTELIQRKLSLIDSLIILRKYKNKMGLPIPLQIFTKKDSQIEFIYQRRICQSLIKSIKKSQDELRHLKNDKEALTLDQKELKDFIFLLQTIAYETIDFARRFDNLKSENIFASDESLHPYAPVRELKILFFSKSLKNDLIKDFDYFLLKFCQHIKDIIAKLNSVSNIKDYDFDMNFIKYYFEFLSKNMKKEKNFENDIIAMNELYKKIYKIIDQFEKIRSES